MCCCVTTTFIVHQAVPIHNQIYQCELMKASNYDLVLNQASDLCLLDVSITVDYLLITIEDYFRILKTCQTFDVGNGDSLRNESFL